VTNETPGNEISAIEVRELSRSFAERTVLRNISLSIRKGECTVIFGPNGAGKTTLIKTMSTLLKPSSGSVFIEGDDIRTNPARTRRRIGLVGHQTYLYDDLTVRENLTFYGRMYSVPQLDARISELAAWLEVGSRLDDRAGTLSRGLQQRVSLARALIHDPSILFLDEPETGLDPRAGLALRDIVSGGPGRTVVLTTHNLERGLEFGRKLFILNRGRVAWQGTADKTDTATFAELYTAYTGKSGE
jgi:heme exporter protein A